MSGGYFNYDQDRMDAIAEDIEITIKYNSPDYDGTTIQKFEEAAVVLRKAAIMVQRIDWLLSGDDGEDTYHERWYEELKGE